MDSSFFKINCLGLALALLILSSCKTELEAEQSKEANNWSVPSSIEFRASTQGTDASRYLGRSFNLISYEINDVDGFTKYHVLDLKKSPWKAFKEVEFSDIKPEIIEEDVNNSEPIRTYHISLNNIKNTEEITFYPSASYKQVNLSFTKKDILTQKYSTNTYYSSISKASKRLSFDSDYPEDFAPYLSKRFVRDLKRFDTSKLIKRYGTHIVTSYTIGAYMRLRILTNSSIFSEDETRKLELKLWDSKVKIPYSIQQKAEKNSSNISIVYKQGGSNYSPNRAILQVSNLYTKNISLGELSETDFISGIRQEDNTFLSLDKQKQGLIAIPDLIANIPLKIKYVSAILEQIKQKNRNRIVYILCDPTDYRPIKQDNKYLNFSLSSYKDCQSYILKGLDSDESLGDGVWNAHLDSEGLWTFFSREDNKFLCRDLKLRSIEEDNTNLRFWLLNPIVPTASGNLFKIKNLLIQN